MDPGVVRRTQESLGKVIRKPPLTDKLLGKPPFRYLHDILTEVIRTTGFFKGLYAESELKSDNVKDKDAKISFLQKAIDVVILVTGEPLTVKPARVVAGHEPEKTNEFLQAIGKCCLNKLSSDDAVKRILSGDKVDLKGKPPPSSKSQDKENREAKDEERRSHKEKEDKRETEIRERSGSRDRKDRLKEDEKKERERRKERERNGETERDGLREGEKNEKEKNRARESRSEKDKERSKETSEREKGRERRSDGSHGKEKDRTREKVRERDREQERNPDKEKDAERRSRDRDGDRGERSRDREEKAQTRERDKERKRERDPERERRKERGRDNDYQTGRDEKPQDEEKTERKHKASVDSTRKASEAPSGEDKPIPEKESSHAGDEKAPAQSKTSRPSASKLRERRPAKPSGEGGAASDEEGGTTTELQNSESHDVADTNIAAQRKIPRPGSARPAPPRVRRQASAEVVAPERVSSGKGVSNVIADKRKDDGDDDDSEFVVEEASPQLSEMPKMELEPELDLTGDEKHGSLVKKILETKKDYETQDTISKDKLLLTDTGSKKEKDLVSKEIEKLRGSIQIVCRSALPLGKMMDYIQEDMDTMKNELQMWRTENREHAEVLLREQSVTDTAVDPLKAELAELEQLIQEQRDKICTVKGNILRNEEKIQKMVQGIGASGRD